MTAAHVLYVSYDGVLEPLGESQALAYVEGLAATCSVTLLSFEKPADLRDRHRVDAAGERLVALGIRWIPLRYHKWPPVLSTLYDVVRGIAVAGTRGCNGRIRLVHARGYVAALIGLTIKRVTGARFLFDMRGFWADEKVDGGHWGAGSRIYRVTKWWERRFLQSADAVVCLTHAGARALPELGHRIPSETPVVVIPTCTDLARFIPGAKDRELSHALGLDGSLVIGCSGTLSNWYLRKPMLSCLAHAVRRLPNAKILVVTRDDAAEVRRDATAAGIAEDRLIVTAAPFADMPRYLCLMDVGLFFIKPTLSKRASAATKLGEFLATGIPVVINAGVGDSGEIVARHRVGVVLPDATVDALDAEWERLMALLQDPEVARRCRETAKQYFDLEQGTAAYAKLYATLLEDADGATVRAAVR